MGIFAIAVYRPINDREEELLNVLKDHLPTLRGQGLVTDRPAHIMRAADGAIVEVFEWKSGAAISDAHRNPAVLKLWERFSEVATFAALRDLDESHEPFANFEPVEL